MAADAREDGATPEQVERAYETYNILMANNNFGKGYWMDDKPFFRNIIEAIRLNFGSDRAVVQDIFAEDAPGKTVDLNKSLFKPLVPAGDTVDDEPGGEPEPVEKGDPVRVKVPMDEDSDADFKELQEKMAKAKAKKEPVKVKMPVDDDDADLKLLQERVATAGEKEG